MNQPDTGQQLDRVETLRDWLIDGALPPRTIAVLIEDVAEALVAAGVALDILEFMRPVVHPSLPGVHWVWTRDRGVKRLVYSAAHLISDPSFVGSPAHECVERAATVRYRFDERPAAGEHQFMARRRRRGATECAFLPMLNGSGWEPMGIGNGACPLGVTTCKPGGWTDADIAIFERLRAPLARITEALDLKANMAQLLSTYVGRNAGQQVLDGRVARGDAERVSAIILFADLEGFTALSNRETPDRVIATLNAFYDALATGIEAQGGEILKFIGDGVLGLFPVSPGTGNSSGAAARALDAVRQARDVAAQTPSIPGFRVALHVGEVTYGNVGSRNRLDFTAIGTSVNLAARLLVSAGKHGLHTVCTDAFADLVPGRFERIGLEIFKGFDAAQSVCRVIL